jgi:chromosome segregation ATPase
MANPFQRRPWWFMAALIIIGGAGIAWYGNTPETHYHSNRLDTIPRQEKKMKAGNDNTIINGNIDEALQSIDRSIEQLKQQDFKKMQQELAASLQKINTEAIQKQFQEALQNIDAEKIKLETEKALQKTDWEKMQQDIQKAIAEVKNNIDSKKIEAELQEALEASKKAMAEAKQIDMTKIHAELDRAKEELKNKQADIREEIERARKEIKENMRRNWSREMEKAKAEMGRAREELINYKTMLSEMEQDGLLTTKSNYTVEYKNGDLIINSKKQPESVTAKYKHYFKKDNVTLKKEPGKKDR